MATALCSRRRPDLGQDLPDPTRRAHRRSRLPVHLVYGSEADRVRNVLAAGHARLTIEGEDVDLTSPRLIDEDEAWTALPDTVKRPPRFLRITEYLLMDLADR